MKILIDIGHPAHVHYFKNFIKIMEQKGHEFLIIAKNRNITYDLLNYYTIPFVKRKDYPSSLIGKLLNIPLTDLYVIKLARKFKPNILLGFSGTHIAHAGKLLRIPSVVIDDTDHATLAHLSYKSFATHILTPSSFSKDFGLKHIRFDGFTDLFYLHPSVFKVAKNIRELLQISKGEKFVVFRFVSFRASHDVGHSGMSDDDKIKLINLFNDKRFKVFISSEGALPDNLKKYSLQLPPEYIHSALFEADMFIGESGTMATEAAILGTPSVLINSLDAGVFKELVACGLLYHIKTMDAIVEIVKDFDLGEDLKEKHIINRDRLLSEKIDLTKFLIWFIENYPESASTMKKNPDYQNKFK